MSIANPFSFGMSLVMFYFAIFGKLGTFRWGKHGRGPLMKPQWIGRAFFGVIGLLFLVASLR